MAGPRDIVSYRSGSRALSVVQKPWRWAHISISVQKPRGAGGGMVTGQIDSCIMLCNMELNPLMTLQGI